MRRLVVLGGAALLLCGVSGCGSDSHVQLARQMLDNINKTNQSLKTIADQKDSKAAVKKAREEAPALKRLGGELRDLSQRAAGLSPEDRDRLEKEFGKQFAEAIAATRAQRARVKKIDGVEEALRKEGALGEYNNLQ